MSRPIRKLLITGAAGDVGSSLRNRLYGDFDLIRLMDIREMPPARNGEETVVADLADAAAIDRLCEGIDAIIHLGGSPRELPWEQILAPNFIGSINIWEGARKAGVDRIIYASSNHAIGFYRRTESIDHRVEQRPDGRYGLGKAFSEDLGRLYAYKYGIRSLMIRIGSFLPEPQDERGLSTWLSHGDNERLFRVGLTADYMFEIVYGISRNKRAWWDNSNAYRLGYTPQDESERYAAALLGKRNFDDPVGELFHGARFTSDEFVGDPSRIP